MNGNLGFQGFEPKEVFPQNVMIMEEDPRSRGGWLWVVKALDSGEQTVIDWEFCFDCHANANEPRPYGDGNPADEFRDYVFFPFRKP